MDIIVTQLLSFYNWCKFVFNPSLPVFVWSKLVNCAYREFDKIWLIVIVSLVWIYPGSGRLVSGSAPVDDALAQSILRKMHRQVAVIFENDGVMGWRHCGQLHRYRLDKFSCCLFLLPVTASRDETTTGLRNSLSTHSISLIPIDWTSKDVEMSTFWIFFRLKRAFCGSIGFVDGVRSGPYRLGDSRQSGQNADWQMLDLTLMRMSICEAAVFAV